MTTKSTPRKPLKLGYAIIRVSTQKQAEVQHGSLEQQRHMIERWLERQCANADHEYCITKFIEEDISGRAGSLHKRHGMKELERAMDQREIDFFVTEKVDRIARDQIYNLQLVRKADRLGIEIFEVESGRINLRDRGSRLGFNVKNFMAEEYSWDLEEKVAKKIREAKVNNAKDNSTSPVLGLDPHPTKVGIYVRNEAEITIVHDIVDKFLEAKSYKPVLEYCNKRGYVTKVRMTKEKIDRNGNRIAARKLGGQSFTEGTLKRLLQSDKLRGISRFKDTWNQFSNLQDENGMVTWNYAHGVIIDEAKAAKIDAVIADFKHRNPKRSKYNDFLLTGILEASDGSRYHGEPAKSGTHNYYVNCKHKRRFRCATLDDAVIERVKKYLDDSGLVRNIYEKSLRYAQGGRPSTKEERTQLLGKQKDLENVIAGFSQSMRQLAVSGVPSQDLASVVETLIAERKAAEAERLVIAEKIKGLETKERQLKSTLEGQTLKVFLKKIMNRFDLLPAREQKRVIQSFIVKVVILDDGTMQLHIIPDPRNREVKDELTFNMRSITHRSQHLGQHMATKVTATPHLKRGRHG